MNEYLKLVEDAQQKRIELTKYQIAAIKDMYNDVWRSLRLRTQDSTFGSLNDRWLKDYRSQFRAAVRELNTILESQLTGAMEQSATYAAEIQSKMFDMLDVDPTFSNMFTKVPKETIAELVGGGFYKDGKGLSKRIWHNKNNANADFDYIIQKGIAEKRSIADIAADLSKYVNPNAKRDMDFKNIYPKIGNRNIEYNSFRLAVTSISHAYQLSMQRSCGKNPFVEGIQWNISNSHRGTCSECRGRDGVIFKPHELPLDHPNGICYFTPVVEKSMEDIGTELRKWVNGSPNDTLDRWYIQNGGKELPKVLENKLSDKKQYEKYKEILGKEVPKTFDKFQELKYNNKEDWNRLEYKYKLKTVYNLDKLKHIEIFADKNVIKHILEGEVNKRGKAVGFHMENMPTKKGEIIENTRSKVNEYDIYSARVIINGVYKIARSTFFPTSMTPQQVVDAINEAYANKITTPTNEFIGNTNYGFKIGMYLNNDGNITTAYPKF